MISRILLSVSIIAGTTVQADAEAYLARCKTGECVFYNQTSRKIVREGSPRVPGNLVEITVSAATSGSEKTKMASLNWNEPARVHFFCSIDRPAFGSPGKSFQAVDISRITGVNEMIANMYLRACHPGVEPGWSIEHTLQRLGYHRSPEAEYPSFKALIAQ